MIETGGCSGVDGGGGVENGASMGSSWLKSGLVSLDTVGGGILPLATPPANPATLSSVTS